MAIIKLSEKQKAKVDECWNVAQAALGNKVAAIKALREFTGLGLKESKELIESGFDKDMMHELNIVIEDKNSPGYHIDQIFILAKQLAYHYEELGQLGFSFTK